MDGLTADGRLYDGMRVYDACTERYSTFEAVFCVVRCGLEVLPNRVY